MPRDFQQAAFRTAAWLAMSLHPVKRAHAPASAGKANEPVIRKSEKEDEIRSEQSLLSETFGIVGNSDGSTW